MNVLKTCRVVVVDDEESEASPLILALSRLGIGAWHMNGDVESLPDSPLDGVRLVFLDLRLGAAMPQAHQSIAQAVSVLSQIVGPSKGSVGIIYWTKSEEDIAVFEQQLKTALPDFIPIFTHSLADKVTLIKAAEAATAILSSVESILDEQSATRLLLEWEQSVHDAVSASTRLLTDVASYDDGSHPENLLEVLAALAHAAGGNNSLSDGAAVGRLFEALNPIHYDQLEQASIRKAGSDKHSAALRGKVEIFQRLNPLSGAKLNGVLTTARCTEDDPVFQPGSVFLPQPTLGDRCPHQHAKLNIEKLCEEMFNLEGDEEYRNLTRRIKNNRDNDKEAATAEREQRFQDIVSGVDPVLIEISPVCDFMLGKRNAVRFLGGILVPEQHRKLIKRQPPFIRYLPPIVIPDREGTWELVANSRYVLGMTEYDEALDSKPLFRLRSPVLVDLVAWCASESSRPGYLYI